MKTAFEQSEIELSARMALRFLSMMQDNLEMHVRECRKVPCDECDTQSLNEKTILWVLHIHACANEGRVSRKYWGTEEYTHHTWFKKQGTQ